MKSQVFGCPGCQQPFQVLAEQAGQIVQCPSCCQSVAIPATAFTPDENLEIQSTVAPDIVSTCNHCRRQFGVTAEMFGTNVACPHCREATEIQDPAAEVPVVKIDLEDTTGLAKSFPEGKSEQSCAIEQQQESGQPGAPADTQKVASIANLLPPTIGLVDSSKPEKQNAAATTDAQPNEEATEKSESTEERSGGEGPAPIDDLLPPRFEVADPTRIRISSGPDSKILLPDGEGGIKQVDRRIVQVEHQGQKVSLVALTPKQRKRRRIIANVIAILVGIAILCIAFLWLT